MLEVICLDRINKMTEEEKRKSICYKYKYFQSFHDCLYCYETREEIQNEQMIYILDENFNFTLSPNINLGGEKDANDSNIFTTK